MTHSKRSWTRAAVGALLLTGILLRAAPARADGWEALSVIAYTALVFDGLLITGGIVTGIGTGVSTATRDRPSLGWIIPGYALGTINAVIGTGITIDGHDSKLGLTLGLGGLLVGVADLALSTVALVKRTRHPAERDALPPSTYRLSLAPHFGPDGAGGAALGLSLRLTDW